MKFKTVVEAFNYYNNQGLEVIEKRAQEIGQTINTDPNADINELNIELDGLNQAKTNIIEKRSNSMNFNPITGMNFNAQTPKVEGGDIFGTPEYRSAFFKELLGQKLTQTEQNIYNQAMDLVETEKRASDFTTITNTPAVVPTQTLNQIISKAREMGGLISHCRDFNIPSNLEVPIGTPGSKAKWHSEGEEVNADKPNLESVKFGAYEIIKIFSKNKKSE